MRTLLSAATQPSSRFSLVYGYTSPTGLKPRPQFTPPFQSTWGRPVLNSTPWGIQLTAYGTGEETHRLLTENDLLPRPREELLSHLQSAVVHQNTMFPVAEPVSRYLQPRTMNHSNWSEALQPFWLETLKGLELFEMPPEPTAENVRQATSDVSKALEDNSLEELYEQDEGSISTLLRHTYCNIQKMRSLLDRHYDIGVLHRS